MDLHWLTKSYMEFWVDPDTPQGMTAYTWKLDKKTGKIEKKSPINIANKPANYYLLENTKGEAIIDILEKELGLAENNFVNTVRNKILREELLSEQDRVHIALFMALTTLRKPYEIEMFAKQINKILDDRIKPALIKQLKQETNNEEELDQIRKQYKKDTGLNISKDDAKKYTQDMNENNSNISLTKNTKLFTWLGKIVNKHTRIILSHDFLILKGNGFITGDLHHFAIFPLTSNYCIMLSQQKIENNFIKITDEKIMQINQEIYNDCNTFLISDSKERIQSVYNKIIKNG